MPATLLATAARVGSPDSASDDDDTVLLILLLPLGSLCPSGAASARRTPLSSASAGLKTQPAAELPAAERDEPAAEQLQVAARPIRAPPWRAELAT